VMKRQTFVGRFMRDVVCTGKAPGVGYGATQATSPPQNWRRTLASQALRKYCDQSQ
jgi:hypothetical protein